MVFYPDMPSKIIPLNNAKMDIDKANNVVNINNAKSDVNKDNNDVNKWTVIPSHRGEYQSEPTSTTYYLKKKRKRCLDKVATLQEPW